MLLEQFSMMIVQLLLLASCLSRVCALSMSYSFSSACTSGCSDEVLSALGDQEALCAIDDLSCVYDCVSTDLIDAHCACGTTALFASYSFDFLGTEEYCCGSSACQMAVAVLYSDMFEDANDTIEAILLGACSTVHCNSYSFSYSHSQLSLNSNLMPFSLSQSTAEGVSMSYSFSADCTSGCSDEVLSALGEDRKSTRLNSSHV